MTYTPMAFFPANFIIQTPHDHDHDHHDDHHHHQQPPINSLSSSFLTSQDFQGGGVSLSPHLGKRSMSFSGFEVGIGDQGGGTAVTDTNMEDDLSDDGLQLGEKKKRLNMIQVKTLEKSFELGNKLEPERKMQLARSLGLQPRQIAIWFQNRRARWKTKQLEKDYDLLKRQFDAIKQENDALQDKNKKLHSEIIALKNRENNNITESINLNKETEGSCSNRSENSSEMRAVTAVTMDGPGPLTSGFGLGPSSMQFFPTSIRPNGSSAQFIQHFSTRPGGGGGDFNNNGGGVAGGGGGVTAAAVKEENLCSMFGFDDQTSGFWPWMDQQQNYN